jgi:hypothetical protein
MVTKWFDKPAAPSGDANNNDKCSDDTENERKFRLGAEVICKFTVKFRQLQHPSKTVKKPSKTDFTRPASGI